MRSNRTAVVLQPIQSLLKSDEEPQELTHPSLTCICHPSPRFRGHQQRNQFTHVSLRQPKTLEQVELPEQLLPVSETDTTIRLVSVIVLITLVHAVSLSEHLSVRIVR